MQVSSLQHLFVLLAALTGCGAARQSGAANAPGAAPLERQSAGALFAMGQAAARRGDNVRAEQYLLLAVQRGYDRRVALPVLLSTCISSMHLRAALDHAQSYLLEHPEADDLRYLVATIQIGLGQPDEAREELERLLRRNPEHADAHFLLGVLYAASDVEAAREQLRLYLAADPEGRHVPEAKSRLADLASYESPAAPAAAARGPRSSWRTR